jgi:pyrroloquinoline-quinone synthase
MTTSNIRQELDRRVAKHDLLCHPFYQAWTKGQLTHDDLRVYAMQYFHQVAAFPAYLKALEDRLPAGSRLAKAVAHNRAEEEGQGSPDGRSHADLWLDFAQGMGADRTEAATCQPLLEMQELTGIFEHIAREGSAAEALAAFYAYESQVPRIAGAKARGLREEYGADEKTCAYFTVHETADVHHARVWIKQLEEQLRDVGPNTREQALQAADRVAQALWRALDGIDRERLARAA